MEFIYTVDPNSETPIMLINKHIGFDSELGMGVNEFHVLKIGQ